MAIENDESVIEAVIFDFDGTLTAPGSLDFGQIRRFLGCPEGRPVLEFIDSLSGQKRSDALTTLGHFELEGARRSQPNQGAEELLTHLSRCGIPFGIISRNSRASVLLALEGFETFVASDFKVLITRDDDLPPKPDPAALCYAVSQGMTSEIGRVLVVGDYVFDIEAGRKAGAQTAFLTNSSAPPPADNPPDYVVDSLLDLVEIVEWRRPLPEGKLPNELLGAILDDLEIQDSSVIVGPGVGEDYAAVEPPGNQLLILKTDPITFTGERLADYAVAVNANDIATAGAMPRWFLVTLLLPPGSTAARASSHMRELARVCRQFGVSLCGGHTEVTHGVTRAVITGQMIGSVLPEQLVRKSTVSRGDRILMTKAVAIEGTSILAREYPEELRALGLAEEDVVTAQRLLYEPGISVVPEAQLASQAGGVSGMHDVTEGGIATALEEFSSVAKHQFEVNLGDIPVLPVTRRLCQALDLSPLGLIGSGTLLITARPAHRENLIRLITAAGIQVTEIGRVGLPGKRVSVVDETGDWPRFVSDEVARGLRQLAKQRDRKGHREEG
jgi:hydrogenase maturation factor/phosphoglycolate phosphatase-like HAD superfamily hydrolase